MKNKKEKTIVKVIVNLTVFIISFALLFSGYLNPLGLSFFLITFGISGLFLFLQTIKGDIK